MKRTSQNIIEFIRFKSQPLKADTFFKRQIYTKKIFYHVYAFLNKLYSISLSGLRNTKIFHNVKKLIGTFHIIQYVYIIQSISSIMIFL